MIVVLYTKQRTGFGIGFNTTFHSDVLTMLDFACNVLSNATPNESLMWVPRLVRHTFARKIERNRYVIAGAVVWLLQGQIGWGCLKNEICWIIRCNVRIIIWQFLEAIVNVRGKALKMGVLLTRSSRNLPENLSFPCVQALADII